MGVSCWDVTATMVLAKTSIISPAEVPPHNSSFLMQGHVADARQQCSRPTSHLASNSMVQPAQSNSVPAKELGSGTMLLIG